MALKILSEGQLCCIYYYDLVESHLRYAVFWGSLNRGNMSNEARSWLLLTESYGGPK